MAEQIERKIVTEALAIARSAGFSQGLLGTPMKTLPSVSLETLMVVTEAYLATLPKPKWRVVIYGDRKEAHEFERQTEMLDFIAVASASATKIEIETPR